ncbi:MAG TPA: hypothetical protein VH349_11585, partial [Ktedonobacterales bacterium]
QLRGEDLDQRADIYALGSVLYEMLTGLPPHIADTPYEVASLVLTTDAAPPTTRNPEIWPELEQVMLRALSRKPADRYANATSFAEALQDALLAHDIELIEPASAVKSSYVKFRTSQPLSKAANGSPGSSGPSVGPGSIWSDGQSHNPTEPPAVPMSGAPPAGNPPRWPPSNQPRDDGAGGGGPGRKFLIFALIGALVVLSACAGVAYAIGVFPPGGGTAIAQNTATATQSDSPTDSPTETLAPTTTTGPGTPTSTPAPTNTSKPGPTATSTPIPPTPTPTQMFDSFYPNAGQGYTVTLDSPRPPDHYQCGTRNGSGASFVFHNPNTAAVSWQWSVSPSLSAANFSWTSSYWYNPQTGAPSGVLGPNQFISIYVRIDCGTGPFTISMTDNRGHSYPDMTMIVPAS